MEENTKGIILALITMVIVSIAQILLKLGSDKFNITSIQGILNQFSNYHLIIGGILYVSGAVLLIIAFRYGELSVVYPIMASSYIIVTLLSAKYLGEVITGPKIAGLFMIFIGVIFIGKSSTKFVEASASTTTLKKTGDLK
jgi:drug/metabolite transporter (DMT)-like permease